MSCPTTAQAANKRLPAGSPKKTPPLFSGGVFHDRVCKPGSVIDSHLSRRTVAGALQPPSRKQPGKPCFLCGVAPDRVYSNGRFHTPLGALLPHLSTLTAGNLRRYLSVALALGSPPAAVSSYPVLRCSDFPHSIPAALSHSLLMDFYYTGFLPFCQVRIFIPFNSLTICFISAVHPYNPDIFLQPVFHMPHTLPSDYYTVHLWCMV